MASLKGKVALVTGAAHPKGMGAAACKRLAELGAIVIATDIDRGSNLEQLGELVKSFSVEGLAAGMDVTNSDEVAGVFAQIEAAYGRLDILFNNAGLGQGVGPFQDIDDAEWDRIWAVNVKGVVNCTRAAIPMMSRSGGSIINNASLAGLGVIAEMAGYSTTKFAVVGFTKSIAAEFGKDGIRCNAICPGAIKTAMYDIEVEHQMKQTGGSREEVIQSVEGLVPLGRSAEPSEVADVVAYLAGPESGYLTGLTIPIAGGMAPGL